MSNVYLKNRTSSAITVAGYTVHYMDKTDAEIVEVEGVENITSSDDASGTISAITLPTAHSYTGVLFDSLRYYASGTFSNTGSVWNAYGVANEFDYGTITWTDESLGDLSSKIDVNPPSSSSMIPQSVFKIIFITDSSITGYSPDVGAGQISDYTYNNGVHSITFYFAGRWINQPYVGRIQFRYLDGVTKFNNLNAFDLISVSGGSLSKDTTTDRYDMYNVWNNSITIHAQYSVQKNQVKYNAFKYLLSSVPYWYVIDGIQTDWIDDLSSIGYSEIQLLPIVTKRNDLYIEPDNYNHQIGSGSEAFLYEYVNGSYRGLLYDDTTKEQCVYGWMYLNSGTWERYYYGLSAVLKSGTSDSLGVRNDTSSTIDVTRILYAECSDPLAVIITVYNSQNAYFNAFKYTIDSVDYYYVLDGTQNDWINDLSSIGYEIKDFEEITLYGNVSPRIACQINVTSGFTGDVNTANVLQLYTDENKTIPFVFDYSNDYEFGYYNNDTGEWIPASTYGTVADMPSSTVDGAFGTVTCKYVLLDTGCLWFICNNSNASYSYDNRHAGFNGTRIVRIRRKDQQYYAGYFNASSTYNNSSLTYGSSYYIYNKPNTGSDDMPLINDFPDKEIVGFYGSAGNLVSSRYSNLSWLTSSPLKVTYRNSNAGTLSVRYMLYTLEEPTYYGWVNLTGNTNSSSGTVYRLRDKEGNYIPYESGVLYTVIGLFKYNGGSATGTVNYLNRSYMGKFNSSYPNDLCWMQQHGSVSVSYVWYIKKHVDTTGMAYCTNKGLNGGNKGSISNLSYYELYDADGNVISVDPSKQYVCTKAFLRDGTSVDNWSDGSYVDTSVCYVRLDSSTGTLKFNANPLPWTNSGYECYSMSYIEL